MQQRKNYVQISFEQVSVVWIVNYKAVRHQLTVTCSHNLTTSSIMIKKNEEQTNFFDLYCLCKLETFYQ